MPTWSSASIAPNEESLDRSAWQASVAGVWRTAGSLTEFLVSELASCADGRVLVDMQRPDAGVDFAWYGSNGEFMLAEIKRIRRSSRDESAREAFREQLAAHREAFAANRVERLSHFAPVRLSDCLEQVEREGERRALLHDLPDCVAQRTPLLAGDVAFERLLSSRLSEQVVVVLDGVEEPAPRSEQRDSSASSWRPHVQVVSLAEAFRRRVDQNTAMKRLGMVLRTLLASLPALAHSAARRLTPPGRLVTGFRCPSRGPDFIPLKTFTPVLSGMSVACA